jgi:prevent-host-death family protein
MVFDHRIFYRVEQIAVSKFKATCLAVLERVQKTGKPVLVTRFGEPVAEVGPLSVANPSRRELGSMRGTARIVGDTATGAGHSEFTAHHFPRHPGAQLYLHHLLHRHGNISRDTP